MTNTEDIRKQKLQLRDNLSTTEREEKSLIVQEKVLQLEAIKRAKNIFIYVSFRSEVSTLQLIDVFLRDGKKIAVPITHVKQRRMDAVHIEDLKRDLEPGYCGILEPTVERMAQHLFQPEYIDAVIIPGSVFDERGGRFGYGGGYYDRFLEQIPHATRIGLAFELQVVAKAPLKSHDELLDYIITEERTIMAER